MRRRLARRTPDELEALASALVTPPDPSHDPEGAARALELLLLVPGEDGRARRLLEGLTALDAATGQAAFSATERVRWRFRLEARLLDAPARAEAASWHALLAPARTEADRAPAAVAEVLRLAASAWFDAQRATQPQLGAEWIAPVLDGRRVANFALALARRPALADALAPMAAWIAEANALDADHPRDGLEALIAAAEDADRAGDPATATQLLTEAAASATDADGLDRAIEARAALLVDPSLDPRAASRWTALARRPIPPLDTTPPAPPRRAWSPRLTALDDGGPVTADADLALLEAAGSVARAARAWLARGDRAALLQAARLSHALDPPRRAALLAGLAGASSDDEATLAVDPGALAAAIARYRLLPPGLDRTLLKARLAALLPAAPHAPIEPEAVEPAIAPHSVDNRLAAASDLLESLRNEAAGTVLAALLRRAEPGPHLARMATLAARALEADPPPDDLREATTRRLRAADDVGEALLTALAANPTGAYAVHEELLALGSDVSRADAFRVASLAAWLAIWRATQTPPDALALTPLTRADPALLPLAAAQLAGHPDPAVAARAFALAHPAEGDPDATARDLLALSLSPPPRG